MGEHKLKSSAIKQDTPGSLQKEVVGSAKRRNTRSRILMLAVIVGGLILCFGGGYLLYNKIASSRVSSVCTDTISKEANEHNKLGNITTFERLVGNIKAKKTYERDPNCQYIIAQFQITAGQLDAAKASIESLRKKHGEKYVFNKHLDDGKASMGALQEQYEVMHSAEQNSKGSIEPEI